MLDSRRMLSLSSLVLMALSSVSLADGPARDPVQEVAQEPFEARISRVRVDVIVTDAEGRFVADLEPADFRIFEDGTRQELLGVTLVTPDPGSPAETAPTPAATPPAREPAIGESDAGRGPAGTVVVPTSDYGTMVYLLDARVLDSRARERFLEGWNRVLAGATELRFPRAVYALDPVGGLRLLVPLTTDLQRLRDSVERLQDWAYFEPLNAAEEVELRNADPEFNAAVPELDERLVPDYLELARGLHTYEVIRILSEALTSRPGRKVLVWVSTGLDLRLQGGGESGAIDPAFEVDPRTEAARRFAERAANTANLSVYGVDPSRASERRRISARDETGPADAVLDDPLELRHDETVRNRDALRLTARATGGEAYLYSGPIIEDVLREIDEESARFYLLTYATPEPRGDGRFHEIRVEVDRPGVEVRHRPGYVDVPESSGSTGRLEPVDRVPGLSTDVPLDLVASERLAGDGRRSVALGVAFEPRADERDWFVEIQAVRNGELVQTGRQEIPRDAIAGIARPDGSIVTGLDWQLEPGVYDLRVAVYDDELEAMSAEQLRVSVGEPCAGWCAGEPRLMTTQEGASAPAFGDVVRAGRRSAVVVEVFAGARPLVSGSVFSADGRERHAVLAAVPLGRRPDGVHAGALELPANLPAGDYVLDVVVTDPEAGQSRISRVSFSVAKTTGS